MNASSSSREVVSLWGTEKYRANAQSQERAVAFLAEDSDGFTPDAGAAGPNTAGVKGR
jgi:hypothetical protein